MTPLELERALESLYGDHWKTEAPKALGINRTTLYRQVTSGATELNPLLVVAVTALLEVQHMKAQKRAYQRTWRKRKAADHG